MADGREIGATAGDSIWDASHGTVVVRHCARGAVQTSSRGGWAIGTSNTCVLPSPHRHPLTDHTDSGHHQLLLHHHLYRPGPVESSDVGQEIPFLHRRSAAPNRLPWPQQHAGCWDGAAHSFHTTYRASCISPETIICDTTNTRPPASEAVGHERYEVDV